MPSKTPNKGKKGAKAVKKKLAPAPKIKKPTPGRTPIPRGAKKVATVTAPTLSCDIAKLIAKRPDEKAVDQHLKAIKAYKKQYKDRLAKEPDVSAHKAKITEAKGEKEATLLMLKEYKKSKGKTADFQIQWTFSAGTGIDQLWHSGENPPQEYIIVEAKGPGATLSQNAAKGPQMSKEWVTNSLDSVIASKQSSQQDKDHAKRMLKAIYNGPPPKVTGVVIEAQEGGGAKEMPCPDNGVYHKTT
jgi:hypothetical protein